MELKEKNVLKGYLRNKWIEKIDNQTALVIHIIVNYNIVNK